jgi:hypothetical protein
MGYLPLDMEFLDINLTKHSSLVLHAIRSSFYWRIVQQTMLYSGFQNPYKKIHETRKLKSIHEKHSIKRKSEGRKPDKKQVYAQN